MEYLNERLQKKQQLEDRTKRFSVAVFKMLKRIPYDITTKIIGYQLGKSSSSIGANYREANRSESKDDFVHKIGIVLKEASETVYWLEILHELYPNENAIADLEAEAREFVRIFQATRKSIVSKSSGKNNNSSQSNNKSIQSVNRSIG